jgi:hypothetical protein
MSREERPQRPIPPPSARLREFFSRLERHSSFTSFEEAYAGLVSILDTVEDDLTGIPNSPESWKTDGRLYPPQMDNRFPVPGHPGVTRLRTRGHNVFIGTHGAIEIREVRTGTVVFAKAGFDRKEVWDDD